MTVLGSLAPVVGVLPTVHLLRDGLVAVPSSSGLPTPGRPHLSAAVPLDVTFQGPSPRELAVEVRDGLGRPLNGSWVSWTLQGNGTLWPAQSAVVDGIASSYLMAGPALQRVTVYATLAGAAPVAFRVLTLPAPPAHVMDLGASSLTAERSDLPADGRSSTLLTLRTTARQEQGVRLQTTLGSLSPTVQVGAGTFQAILTAPTQTGSAQIVVTGAASPRTTVRFVAGPPTRLVPMEPSQDATMSTGSMRHLVVRLEDRYGNPVLGSHVQWSLEGAGTLQGSGATDGNGTAAVDFAPGPKPGLRSLVARVAALDPLRLLVHVVGDAHPYHIESYSVHVGLVAAEGYVALPTDIRPTTLVVLAHGCCGALDPTAVAEGWGGMAALAQQGAAVVGMNYRGRGGWDVMNGSQDLVAATLDLQARLPINRTILYGVSMGGEVSGIALASRPDLFDYWVDTFGVTNLPEEFLALGAAPGIRPDPTNLRNPIGSWILDETGGTPGVSSPEAWRDRSPALLASRMVGLKRAYIAHGLGDLVVPASQSIEMFDALTAAHIPASLALFGTRHGGVQGPEAPDPTSSGPWDDRTWSVDCPSPVPAGQCVGLEAHETGGQAYLHNLAIVGQLVAYADPDAGTSSAIHARDAVLPAPGGGHLAADLGLP